jgi:tRNA(Ile)-lysidine synthase
MAPSLLTLLQQHLQHLLPAFKQKTYLLAVSGGVDSMALIGLFQSCQLSFQVAHVNFGLRGLDSNAEMKLVANYCKQAEIPFHIYKADKEAIIKGESTQMWARRIRYSWFKSLAAVHKLQYICTAHHQNDFAETAIIQILRKELPTGIAAINDTILRPLLPFSKKDLQDFCTTHNIAWREDKSNKDDSHYLRNKIRLNLVPALSAIEPNWAEAFAEVGQQVQAIQKQIGAANSYLLAKHPIHNIFQHTVPWSLLTSLPFPEEGLFALLQSQLKRSQMADLLALKHKAEGAHFINDSKTLQITNTAAGLHLSKYPPEVVVEAEIPAYTIPFANHMVDFESKTYQLSASITPAREIGRLSLALNEFPKSVLFANANLSKATTIVVRPWQPGDRFVPLGSSGSKNISDFLTDRKIKGVLKKKIQVLVADGQIWALIGVGIAQIAKVQPGDQTAICLKLEM